MYVVYRIFIHLYFTFYIYVIYISIEYFDYIIKCYFILQYRGETLLLDVYFSNLM